ncbi:hypothetical protein [uncultured Arthrobacter sp.]|uniref:hypothetical protein n=1 Tax=uncultured Arthrobacter sp. TaxID=114050 RepID=UPI003217022C
MSTGKAHGRRRAVTVRTSPLATVSKAVADNAGGVGRQAAVIAAASGLVLTSGIAAQAAEAPAQRDSAPVSNLEVTGQAQSQLRADSSVRISFERPAVATTPAPVIEAPAAAVAAPQPAAAVQAPAAKTQITVAPKASAAPAAAPTAAGGVNATMVSAAYAQLGLIQDCTRLVEKALGAAGIPVGDLAPMQFMNYGKVVGAPAPGDMVIQPGHIGIYVGDGQVLSSGMNGKNQTVVHPLSWLTATGPVTFVRAGA